MDDQTSGEHQPACPADEGDEMTCAEDVRRGLLNFFAALEAEPAAQEATEEPAAPDED